MFKKRIATSLIELSIYIIIITTMIAGTIFLVSDPNGLTDDAEIKNTLVILDTALSKYHETHMSSINYKKTHTYPIAFQFPDQVLLDLKLINHNYTTALQQKNITICYTGWVSAKLGNFYYCYSLNLIKNGITYRSPGSNAPW